MKNKSIVLITLLVICGLFYYFSSDNESTTRIDRKDFAVSNIEDVDRIVISSKEPTRFELIKKGNEWLLDNKYTAKKESVEHILNTLNKMEIKYPVSKNSVSRVLNNLSTVGVKVEVFAKGGHVKTLFVGNNTPDELATYMMLKGAISPYAIHLPGFIGFLKTRFSPDPLLWKSKKVMSIDNKEIEWLTMEYPNRPEDGFKIVQDKDGVKLFDIKGKEQTIKKNVVTQYLANFKNIVHEGFIASYDPVQPEEIVTLPKIFKLKIKGKGQNVITLDSYQKTELQKTDDENKFIKMVDRDRLFATDGDSFFMIQYFVFNPLLKQITDFK